jgi:hypothetical protein
MSEGGAVFIPKEAKRPLLDQCQVSHPKPQEGIPRRGVHHLGFGQGLMRWMSEVECGTKQMGEVVG